MAEHPHPAGYRFISSLKAFTPRLGKSLLAVAALGLISLLLVLPTWYLASNFPQGYTWTIISLIFLALVIRGILALHRSIQRYGLRQMMRKMFLPFLAQRVPGFVLGSLGILALFFFLTENLALAALLAFLFFLGVGLRIL